MSTRAEHEGVLETVVDVLGDMGRTIDPGVRILDFGCGAGELADLFRLHGYPHVTGVDVDQARVAEAISRYPGGGAPRYHVAELAPYRVPLPDQSFDVVVSSQVIEHVHDLDAAMIELYRVTRPGGVGVHVFPPRFRIIESHTYVPFGNVLRSHAWHRLWILLGRRRRETRGMDSASAATVHLHCLATRTCYRSLKQITSTATRSGFRVRLPDGLRYSRRLRRLRWASGLPLVPAAYRTFVSIVLVLERPA